MENILNKIYGLGSILIISGVMVLSSVIYNILVF